MTRISTDATIDALSRVRAARPDAAQEAYSAHRFAQPAIFGGVRVIVVRPTVRQRARPLWRRLLWQPWRATETVITPAPIKPTECFRVGEAIYVGEEAWRLMCEAVGTNHAPGLSPLGNACAAAVRSKPEPKGE